MKSIEQRQHTLRSIAEYILEHQKGFFEQGCQALKPMTLKDVANAIDRNGDPNLRSTCRIIALL